MKIIYFLAYDFRDMHARFFLVAQNIPESWKTIFKISNLTIFLFFCGFIHIYGIHLYMYMVTLFDLIWQYLTSNDLDHVLKFVLPPLNGPFRVEWALSCHLLIIDFLLAYDSRDMHAQKNLSCSKYSQGSNTYPPNIKPSDIFLSSYSFIYILSFFDPLTLFLVDLTFYDPKIITPSESLCKILHISHSDFPGSDFRISSYHTVYDHFVYWLF